jgi:hypothetical protein
MQREQQQPHLVRPLMPRELRQLHLVRPLMPRELRPRPLKRQPMLKVIIPSPEALKRLVIMHMLKVRGARQLEQLHTQRVAIPTPWKDSHMQKE